MGEYFHITSWSGLTLKVKTSSTFIMIHYNTFKYILGQFDEVYRRSSYVRHFCQCYTLDAISYDLLASYYTKVTVHQKRIGSPVCTKPPSVTYIHPNLHFWKEDTLRYINMSSCSQTIFRVVLDDKLKADASSVIIMSLVLLIGCGVFLWQPTVIGSFLPKYSFSSLFRPENQYVLRIVRMKGFLR